jgi:hypothetical protein
LITNGNQNNKTDNNNSISEINDGHNKTSLGVKGDDNVDIVVGNSFII